MPFIFAIALVALALTALSAAALLRLESFGSFALAAYLLAVSELVVLTEFLSPARLVGRWGYLACEVVLLTTALVAWHARGRPRPSLPLVDRGALRRHPILAVLAAAVAVAGLYQAFLVFATPPNNGDSMSQHLSRAAAWLQHGGVYWIQNPHTLRENEWPPVGEIPVLWTFALLDRDAVAASVQLVAEGGLLLAVFGAGRRLGFGRAPALFAALVAATLPQVALQSVTTQVDLLVASFVAAAAYFLRSQALVELALAGVAVGLAVGTKATALLALPALALLALVSLPRRRLAVAVVCSAAGFALVGAYGYALNLSQAGNVFGTGVPAHGYRPKVTFPGTVSSLAKMAFRTVDLPGYHVPPGLRRPFNDGTEHAFRALRIPVAAPESQGFPFAFDVNISSHEDIAWYGPLGFLLLVPLMLVFSVLGALRRVGTASFVLALAVPIYAVGLALAYRDGPWYGRYLISGIVLLLPLVAAVYRYRAVAAAVAAVGVMTLALVHVFNANKPSGVGHQRAAWHLSRPEAQAVGIPGFSRVIAAVDEDVPADARLGIVMREEDWDYPFYGRSLDRRLVPLPETRPLDAAEQRDLRYVLVGRTFRRQPPDEPGWSAQRFSWQGTLFVRSS